MITCTKVYSDIPFAHRQHTHGGHCSFIHGHNWSIEVTFEASELDENGFVVDFGKLKFLKQWIEDNLDHACLLNESDAEGLQMTAAHGHLIKLRVLPDVSCEGLAKYIQQVFDALVRDKTGGRVWVKEVTVHEDSKNRATYRPEEG